MHSSVLVRRPLLSTRTVTVHHAIRCMSAYAPRYDSASYIPRVASPSLWKSAIPKFMRRRKTEEGEDAAVTTSERGPGISLIVLGLVVGSFAINILALKREVANYSRKTHAKVELLKELIKDLREGKDVDVRARLGTGDPEAEAEWEEMVQEISSRAFPPPKKSLRERKDERAKKEEAQSVSKTPEVKSDSSASEPAKAEKSRPQFLM